MEEQVIQETPVAPAEQPVAEQSDLSTLMLLLTSSNFKLNSVKTEAEEKELQSESWMSS